MPNLVLAGTVEALYQMSHGYVPYLVLHAPVLGVLKGLLLIVLISFMFPDHIQPMASSATGGGPLTAAEWRLIVILAATLGLWGTDAWHGLSPAWIGLAAAVLCLLPGVGFLPPEAFGQLNFRTMFYVAAILGLASMIRETGLGTLLGHGLLGVTPLDPQAPFWNFTALAGLTTVLSLAVPNGAPVLFTPMAAEVAAATGFGLPTVVMMSVLGFSTVVLPFQAPPIILALELGVVRLGDATRLSLVSAALTLLLLVPVTISGGTGSVASSLWGAAALHGWPQRGCDAERRRHTRHCATVPRRSSATPTPTIRLPLAAGGATCRPPVGSAPRANGYGALPPPSAPKGAQ